MEEQVGKLWHRFLGNLLKKDSANNSENDAVQLEDVRKKMSIVLRSMAQNANLSIEPSFNIKPKVKRSLLKKIAGTKEVFLAAWIDDDVLYLPEKIALFSSAEMNYSLYLWLTALAATENSYQQSPDLKKTNQQQNFDKKYPSQEKPTQQHFWFVHNQQLVLQTLDKFPGLNSHYQQLLTEVLHARADINNLSDAERQQEQVIIKALKQPGTQQQLPPCEYNPVPIALWLLQPIKSLSSDMDDSDLDGDSGSGQNSEKKENANNKRKQAERVKMPDGKNGLISVRMENIFSWAEFLKVDRTTDDDEDPDAAKTAEDMEHLSLARDKSKSPSKINFNLDLPSAAYDDRILNEGILYPEWHYKKQQLLTHQCKIIPMINSEAESAVLPDRLLKTSLKIRRIFEALTPVKKWFKGQSEGSELDLDAYIQLNSDRYNKTVQAEQGLYKQFRSSHRDLATLLLADLSLSTDSSINNDSKVIDVIRDSLFLFSEALTQTGDSYALYGFSSKKKDHVRFNQIKTFNEPLNSEVRGRIQSIKPGYYTRMGTAIRHASSLLMEQSAEKRILLILTDGKPNDLDHYEGRYGIEDTRHAVMECKSKGLIPFCFTIDKEANDYLPHIFGPNGYTVIRKAEQLPAKLPILYAEITQ